MYLSEINFIFIHNIYSIQLIIIFILHIHYLHLFFHIHLQDLSFTVIFSAHTMFVFPAALACFWSERVPVTLGVALSLTVIVNALQTLQILSYFPTLINILPFPWHEPWRDEAQPSASELTESKE